MFNHIDPALMALIVALLIVVVGVGAYYVTTRFQKAAAHDVPFDVIQASAFALVGLLLGFSFSLALARYDLRRDITVREGNAITTAGLRTDLLDPRFAKPIRQMLREYVQVRIDFASGGTQATLREIPAQRSDALQARIWTFTMAAERQERQSQVVPLFIVSLNNMFDASGEQAAALAATIPDSVLLIVIVVTLIAASLLGGSFARVGRFDPPAFVLFAVMLALVIATILDLDRPQRGYIRVPLEPLLAAQRTLVTQPPPALSNP